MPRKTSASLKQNLTLLDATAINIGAIVGAGIFVVTGIVAGLAGSAMVISLLLAALVSFFTALSFAELAAFLPSEGGSYEFAYQLISPFAGFTAGWMWLLSNVFVGAALALGFSQYLATFFPAIPVRLVAVAITVVFAILNVVGAKSSAQVNNVLVVAKLAILAFFVAVGVGHIKAGNLQPFDPFQPGVLYGAYFVFFAFAGFARVTLLAAEVKEPRKNVPRSIMLALLISTIVYFAVGVTAVGLAGPQKLADSGSPLAAAISVLGSGWMAQLVAAGGLIATASVLLTTILGVSRLSFAMAQRKALPSALGRLHQRFDTPYVAIAIGSLLMVLLVFVSDIAQVVAVSTLASLAYYALGNVAALRMPSRQYPSVVSWLGVISCVGFSLFILVKTPEVWGIGAAMMAAGALYYYIVRRLSLPK